MPWWTAASDGAWAPMTRAVPLSRDHVTARAVFTRAGSWWTRPLPAAPPVVADSASIVSGTLAPRVKGISLDRTSYTPRVVIARNSDPVVTFTYDKSSGYAEHPDLIRTQLTGLHIPRDANPAAGTDQEICVVNADSGTVTDIWHATKIDDMHWTASWAGTIADAGKSDGIHTAPWGATASGLAFLPLMVCPDELADGWIGHALGIGLPKACLSNVVSWPANRTDGEGTGSGLIAEGQRLFLPRSVDLDALGLSRTCRTVARAAQEYGLVVWDRGEDSTTIRAVNATGMTADPYPALTAGHSAYPLANFPVASLQVMPRDWRPT